MVSYNEISCKTACNKIKSKFPYPWDLNIYRGCEHGCRYCFAVYSHRYLESSRYFDHIYVKTNIVERLEAQLSSRSWKGEVINIGGVTDSYQPAEEMYKIMPSVLRLMIRYRNPCIISTKSDLILRDFDLIDELSRVAYVNVAATVTCSDEHIRRVLEPGGSTSAKRCAFLREFSGTGVSTGMHIMPIVPYLTDSDDNIEALFSAAQDCDVSYAISCVMNLRGATRGVFFDFIGKRFPRLYGPLRELYRAGDVAAEYKKSLYERIRTIRTRYGISSDYGEVIHKKIQSPGGTLF